MEDRKQVEKVISMLKDYDEETIKEDPKPQEQQELIKKDLKIILERLEILKADNTKNEEVGKNGR